MGSWVCREDLFQVALSLAFPVPPGTGRSRGLGTTATAVQRALGRAAGLWVPLACQTCWSIWRRLFAEGEEISKLKTAQNDINENTWQMYLNM